MVISSGKTATYAHDDCRRDFPPLGNNRLWCATPAHFINCISRDFLAAYPTRTGFATGEHGLRILLDIMHALGLCGECPMAVTLISRFVL